MSVEFVDTNVLVYAYGDPGEPRAVPARDLLHRLWRDGTGAVSVQVLQELCVTLTRKVDPPVPREIALERIAALGLWRVFCPRTATVREAAEWEKRHDIHFWDAMILVSAHRVGAQVVWSEDLNDGQVYDGVTVRNPFRTD